MDKEVIRQELKRSEGSGLPGHPFQLYKDSRGLWTIGWGFLVDPSIPGAIVPPAVAEFWLDYLIDKKVGDANFDWFPSIGEARQNVVICLIYNMGLEHFLQFHKMIAALAAGQYNDAADDLQNSLWFKQVDPHPEKQERGVRYINILRTNVWE